MFGCFGYIVNFAGRFMFPSYEDTIIASYVSIYGSQRDKTTGLKISPVTAAIWSNWGQKKGKLT